MKFKSIFRSPGSSDFIIGTYKTRKEAVEACVNYRDHDYCLDSREERMKCFEFRDYCICGCGPNELAVEEVES